MRKRCLAAVPHGSAHKYAGATSQSALVKTIDILSRRKAGGAESLRAAGVRKEEEEEGEGEERSRAALLEA